MCDVWIRLSNHASDYSMTKHKVAPSPIVARTFNEDFLLAILSSVFECNELRREYFCEQSLVIEQIFSGVSPAATRECASVQGPSSPTFATLCHIFSGGIGYRKAAFQLAASNVTFRRFNQATMVALGTSSRTWTASKCLKRSPRLPSISRYTQVRDISLSTYIVTPKEVHNAMSKNVHSKISTAPRIVPICASWFLPNDAEGRTGQQVFKAQRIPTARFFDLDGCKDHESRWPHMLPTAENFAKAMEAIGIRRDDEVVVYDSKELGLFSAPRVGWTFKIFGHPSVHVLNNFRLWVDQGLPTESGEVKTVDEQKSKYPVPSVNPDMVVKFAEVKDIAKDYGKEGSDGIQILDARGPGRFSGSEPEPRPGVSSGHIPGSINVPHSDLLDSTTGAFLPSEQLRKVFEEKGVDPEKPIITTCGTGVTAAVIDAALAEADFGQAHDRRVYDGSWT